MKTLLVFPRKHPLAEEPNSPRHSWERERPVPPLGIAYLGAMLENDGFTVSLLDCNLSNGDSTARQIEQADVVGISAPSIFANDALDLARYAKQSGKTVIVGGPHATISPSFFLEHDCVDFVIRGEGEYTLLELLNEIERDGDCEKVRGVSCKREEKIVHSPDRPPIEDLDSVPFPARHLLDMKAYLRRWRKNTGTTFVTMITSRGCPYSCIFCSKEIFGRAYRTRSARNVIDEVQLLVNDYAPDFILFNDDVFALDGRRVFEICNEMIERKIRVDWGCESRVDNIEPGMLRSMRKAGCRRIAFGVESGSQRVLDFLNKKMTVEQIRSATRLAKRAGIEVTYYVIIGTPCETQEDIELTRKLVSDEKPDYLSVSFFTPLPGTQAWQILENNLIPRDPDQFDYFNSCVFKHENLSLEELKSARISILEEFRMKALLRYCSSPRKILRVLRRPRLYWSYWKWMLNV